MSDDLHNASLLDLFRMETETQTQVLGDGLLALERQPGDAAQLEACMRAAHSLKGAARIVGVDAGVALAHAMEDVFVAAQQNRLRLSTHDIDHLLHGVDLLMRVAQPPGGDAGWAAGAGQTELDGCLAALQRSLAGGQALAAPSPRLDMPEPPPSLTMAAATTMPMAAAVSFASLEAAESAREIASNAEAPVVHADTTDAGNRSLRVSADSLNQLLRLSSEALVASRWSKPFAQTMQRLKRQQHEAGALMDLLQTSLVSGATDARTHAAMADLRRVFADSRRIVAEQIHELEQFDRRSTQLSQRLYDEALACRMRPIADRLASFPRMVRDLGRELGKPARLEIVGADTEVDRDILEKLEAPLGHLLRNAVDHGLEPPEARRAAGKPAEGVITLSARHSAGVLVVSVRDDGAGIDLDRLRATIVARGLGNGETAAQLGEAELLEFLLLPGFTLRDTVTDVSGRGVGLDAVHAMVRDVRGTIRITHTPGAGTRFQLQLPLTLSVIRSLLVDIGGESYALPLATLSRTLALTPDQIETLEGHPHFMLDGRPVGLVAAQQILYGTAPPAPEGPQPVVVIGERDARFGLAVDRFLGERMLVVQPLDPRLGKVKDIAAGSLMEDGSPVLIIDTADMLRSIAKAVEAGTLARLPSRAAPSAKRSAKRVLVVDDSLTVRELERKLLGSRGYDVTVAVDGMDGWNAVRSETFDLVITDVDMPRMDGIELVSLVKRDARLAGIPVMIVSYKDRAEDRQRGLDAGADYYLAKSSFHDDALLRAVVDLIGEGA
ncbi:Gliding motility regulatory protein [Pandoraea terrae]|uniref:Chemotaxis protein CheA n=1 Tax=Pandoraea terrae TaxID=1537710 RepID=A0A5E4THM4_9BURK|nr:hybrid sensor histidine kinase/response regulator [Pandoraea terrae]VVD86014.1 Gliding motility regulatory protein [Pandoraea terrae]